MNARAPLIALVGRPNVGKSTLFNRLVDAPGRSALVDDRPGVTRDRIFGNGSHEGKALRYIDTGGFDSDPDDPLLSRMREQTQLAIDEADMVILLLDGADGLRPADREVAQLLRRAGKPLLAAVNKADVPEHDDRIFDFYELGLEPVIPVSAEHGRGIGPLLDAVCELVDAPDIEAIANDQQPLPVSEDEPEGGASRVEGPGGPIRVAVIGRPNVGKSSLVNHLLGKERLLATEIAGTTRDSIDAELEHEGQAYVFVDTAGIRRKRSIADRVERFSVMAARRSLESADVAVVVLDGTERPSDQDAHIISMAHDRGKGLVIVANKWDLIENQEWRDKYPEAIRHDFPFVTYATLLRLSAKTGRGAHKISAAILGAQRERHRRVGTGELNRFFKDAVARHPPPLYKGKKPSLYYVSQPLIRPPTFVFTTGRPDAVSGAYARYLRNALRERYGFEGTPIWLKFRPRGHSKSKGKSLD